MHICSEDMDFGLRAFWVGDAISFFFTIKDDLLSSKWLTSYKQNEYRHINALLLLFKCNNV